MGFVEMLSDAGGYFKERWDAFKITYADAWTKDITQASKSFWSGVTTMAMSPQFFGDDGRDSYVKGLRLWMDGVVGVGGSILKGTLGGAFELPALHEGAWLLDKAYRYGFARPVAWSFGTLAAGGLEAEQARDRGEDPLTAYFRRTLSLDTWLPWGSHGMWSDEMGKMTPGQAIMWAAGGQIGMINPGNPADREAWLRANDPRTESGQARFNSPDAQFILKYGSGTMDFMSSIFADPSIAAVEAARVARVRLTNVATPDYIRKGLVDKEVTTEKFQRLLQAAKDAPTSEALRDQAFARNTYGGPVSAIMWAAARVDDELARDAYVVMRGMDGLPLAVPGTTGGIKFGAWERIQLRTPEIASELARLFANWNIGEDSLGIGRSIEGSKAPNSLALNDAQAFLQAFAAREGLWGRIPGLLAGEAQPGPTRLGNLRSGVHSWVLHSAPVIIGRPLATVMPSQGYTSFIDAEDGTAIALRQVRANLERAGMAADRVDHWVSQWSTKATREGRNSVYELAEDEGIRLVAERHGLDEATIREALPEISRYRDATRQILRNQRVFFTDMAANRGARLAVAGRAHEATHIQALNKGLSAAAKKGNFGDEYLVVPNVDGHTVMQPFQSARVKPEGAADVNRPLLLSQTTPMIATLDLRALDGALKWWKLQHRPVAGIKGWTLSKVARTHAAWDSLITASDFANMIWKTSALLRPAQTPRNLADDVFRRMLTFGKLHIIMGAMRGTKRAVQNLDGRVGLLHEHVAEIRTGRRLARTTVARGTADVAEGVAPFEAPNATRSYGTVDGKTVHVYEGDPDAPGSGLGKAWVDEVFDFPELIHIIETLVGSPGRGEMAPHLLVPREVATQMTARDQRIANPAGHLKARKKQQEQEQLVGEIPHMTDEELALVNEVRQAAGKPPYTRAILEKMQTISKKDLDTANAAREIEGLEPLTREQLAMRPEPLTTDQIRSLFDLDEAPRAKRNPATPHIRQFKRVVANYYLQDFGTAFLDEQVRLSWFETIMEQHQARREALYDEEAGAGALDSLASRHIDPDIWAERGHSGENPYQPGQLIIDPLTGFPPHALPGTSREASWTLDNWQIITHENLNMFDSRGYARYKPTVAGPGHASNELEGFILDHLDDLKKPDHFLTMSVDPLGNIRMGVARPKSRYASRPNEDIQLPARQRLRNFKIEGIVDSAHEKLSIEMRNPAGGTTEVQFPAAFGGGEGEAFMHRISAREMGGTYNYLVGEFNQNRILDRQAGWGISQPHEKTYDRSWERAVNAQIASDPVARMFLEGATESDVIHWIERTPDGTAYLHRSKHLGVNYTDHVSQIKGMVDEYVPAGVTGPDGVVTATKAGSRLRQAVLERKARRSDLDSVIEDRAMQPEVHGASVSHLLGRGAIFNMIANGIDRAQKLLSDLPTDKASRFPFFAEAYRRHLTDLIRTADNQAAKFGGGVVPTGLVHRLERQARERALYDTKYRLYDVAQVNDLARLTRFIVPFSSAIMDSYIKYGRLIRENPARILQGLYYWQMFERNEQIQDENGYVLRNDGGGERWYSVDPASGEMTEVPTEKVGTQRYVQFRLPSELGHLVGKKFYGVDMQPVMAINQKSFNVFIDLPSAGPFVAIPANEFALSNPEFGESDVIKKFVLPFGPSVSRGKVFVPANVRNAWTAFVDQEGGAVEANAKAIYQAELISYTRGERNAPPTLKEVRARAGAMMGLKFASSWISPLSFQVQSPYQPYIDTYRQLAAADAKSADERFYAQHGDEFYAVTMTVTRNIAGVRASLESQASFDRHKELVGTYPELAGLIVGADGGAFAKSVYEMQKETPIRTGGDRKMREVMSLDESAQELEKRRVWDKYTQLMDLITAAQVDRGLKTLRGKAAQDLVRARDAFIAKNKYWYDPSSGREVISPWFQDFSEVDHSAMETRVENLWQVVQDKDLQKRDDIRGLIEYLHLRKSIVEEMASRGLRSLSSKGATDLAGRWNAGSFSIRESNPAFGLLWSRWLSRDDDLQIPKGV